MPVSRLFPAVLALVACHGLLAAQQPAAPAPAETPAPVDPYQASLAKLKSDNPMLRRQAAEELGQSRRGDAIAPLLGLADVAVRKGKPQDALKLVEQAQKLAPEATEVRIAAGRLAYALGKKSDAENHFKRAAAGNPKISAPLLDLGEFYMAERRHNDAIKVFTTAAGLPAPHPGASFGLGRALVAIGNTRAALGAFEQAAKLAPGNPLPMVAMAELQLRSGDSKQALALVDKALLLDPKLTSARLAPAPALGGRAAGERLPILYGGSVTPDNIGEFLALREVDGALVGGACLDPVQFAKILAVAHTNS